MHVNNFIGFTRAGPPNFDPKLISSIAPDLPATIIVLIIEHIAIGKSFARLNGYTVVPSQELVSIAFTNLTGPFVGAYASTGSFGGSAILSKAGVRTPLAGIFNGCILVLALYALTSVLYYIPLASLSALIIHAVVNLITSPEHVYHSWLMSPFDALIYFCGVFVSIFTSLEDGIYTTVALSIAVMLIRVARTQARFMGKINVHRHSRTVGRPSTPASASLLRPSSCSSSSSNTTSSPSSRPAFLPLDRHDGSNPALKVEAPLPGLFIYRFSEGFNYINQAQHMDHLISTITQETKRTCQPVYAHPGDRPWNEPMPVSSTKLFQDDAGDLANQLPTLKAVVFDFSAVNNLDTGAAEGLAIAREQLDKWAYPDAVEYHFAGVTSRWARRALAVAGFGCPSKREFALKKEWEPIYSVAEKGGLHWPSSLGETASAESLPVVPSATAAAGEKKAHYGGRATDAGQKVPNNMAAVHGINRPNFHIDLAAAVQSCTHSLQRGIRSCDSGHAAVVDAGVLGRDVGTEGEEYA